jgi:hypothetical protein
MRETIIAIASFAGSAILTALAVLVPPQSFFWLAVLYVGICVLFLCGIALLINIIWQRRQRPNMTPADIGFNGALVAAAVSTIAAIKHYPRIAVVAAIMAWVGIGADYWLGPPRAFIFPQGPRLIQGTGGPIGWFPHAQAVDPGNKQTRYFLLEMVGTNQGEEEIRLDDAYFVSGVTGAQVYLKVQMPNKPAAISEINPIPPKASVSLFTELSPPMASRQMSF